MKFGTLAVGDKVIASLCISSEDDTELKPLHFSSLDHRGNFQILNAVRPLESGGESLVHVQFSPLEVCEFSEKLTLTSGAESVRIYLYGEGVLPSITMDKATTEIDLGYAAPGSFKQGTFSLSYDTKCPLKYELSVVDDSPAEVADLSSFHVHPSSGVVESEGENF